jgi:hypothetical protein
MRSVVLFAVASLVASAACSSKRGGAKKIPRERDAMDVVIVDNTRPSEMKFGEEAEPNDSQAEANVLGAGTGMRGTLDGATDADFYKVTLETPGILDAQLSGIEKVDLMLDLRDIDGKVIAKSDRGPAKINEGIPNYPLPAGDYYLVVAEFVKKKKKKKRKKSKKKAPAGRQGASAIYDLSVKVGVTPEADFEVEPNADAGDAVKMLIGDEHFGYIGWSKDVDTWRLGLDGFTENYSADVDISGVDGVTYTLEIIDPSGEEILVRKGKKGGGLAVRNLVPDLSDDAPKAHYVRIKASRSNPSKRYEIVMTTRLILSEEEEIEPNDDPDTATALRENGKVDEGSHSGYLTTGDQDYYYLEVGGEPSVLDVQVVPPAKTNVKIEVGEVGGGKLGMTDRGKRGAAETLEALPVGAGKMIWIRVHGARAGKDLFPYTMKWSLEPAPPPGDDDDDDGSPSIDDLDDYKDE